MKKRKNYIIILILCMIFGIILGYFLTHFNIDRLFFYDLNIAIVFLIFFISLVFSITIHELSHALYFVINKVPIKLFAVFMFCFLKENGKYNFRIYPNKITIFGGIVIPDLPYVKSEVEYNRLRKVYYKDLIFAPIISMVFSLISVTIYLMLHFITKGYMYVYIKILLISISFICLSIFFSSFIKLDNIYGDFPAYKIYKENDMFALLQLCQYSLFNENYHKVINKESYVLKKVFECVENIDINSKEILNLKILDLIIQMDNLNIINLNNKILILLSEYFNMKENFFLFYKGEDRDIFYVHMLYALLKYKFIDINIIREEFNAISDKLFIDNPVKEYYLKLIEKALFGYDCKEWLLKNINPNNSYDLLKIFPTVYQIEYNFICQYI